MNVFNGNKTLEFKVDNDTFAGKQYFFKIILKEVGLNVTGVPYYV